MKKLITGLHHFQSNVFESQKELFERLAEGQAPEALFITCSDSRINPNLITQTNPGDIFVLRNAGNIIPPYGASNGGEGATIEFAVAALGVKDIIICGHTHCGAVKAICDPSQVRSLPSMAAWLSHAEATRRIVEENYKDLEGSSEDLLNIAIQENVLVQLENLRTHPVVAARLARQALNLHAWTYKIESGQVFSYDCNGGQFNTIKETPSLSGLERPRLSISNIL
jgi:Carbonic anhydrase